MAVDLPSAQLAATVALNLSVAIVTGANMSAAWLRTGRSSWALHYVDRLRTVTVAAVVVALLAYVAALWLEAAAMAEVAITAAAPAVHLVLTSTHYGFAWTIGFGALALVTGVTAVRWPPRLARAAELVRLLAIGAFLYSRSMVSHAGAGGDVSWAVAADWLHLILISLWVGEVIVAGLITLRLAAGIVPQDRLDRAKYIGLLSNSATLALAGILITGLVSGWRGLGSLENATGNPYATVLLIKVALVATAAMLGGVNRFFFMPDLLAQLRAPCGTATTAHPELRFASLLQIEAIILLAALTLAAVLSSTSPPAAG